MAAPVNYRRAGTGPNGFTPAEVIVETTIPGSHANIWFEQHQGEKPSVNISSMNLYLNQMRSLVLYHLKNNNNPLTSPMAVKYMYLVMMTDDLNILNANWSSFRRVIGAANQACIFNSLFSINEIDAPMVAVQDAGNASMDHGLLTYLCCLGSFEAISRPDYRGQKQQEIVNYIRSLGIEPPVFAYGTYKALTSNVDYKKMTALIDMYYTKFPKGKFRGAKFGTIITRYKGCAALEEWFMFRDTLNCDSVTACRWIWDSSIMDEITRMAPNGGLDDVYGYMPYFMSLGLASKSALSTTMNPNFHLFSMMIGATLGSTKAINARMISPTITGNILANACMIAYAIAKKVKLAPQLTDPDEEVGNQMPDQLIPEAWLGYIQGNRIPRCVKAYCASRWKTIRDVRNGTIGQFLQTLAPAFFY